MVINKSTAPDAKQIYNYKKHVLVEACAKAI